MKYSIEEKTLTDIGDALRKRHGETKVITVIEEQPIPSVVVSKSNNAIDANTTNGNYEKNLDVYDVVQINGASEIKVTLAYNFTNYNTTDKDYLQIAVGKHNVTTFPTDVVKYDKTTETAEIITASTVVKLSFKDTDAITFYFHTDATGTGNALGYYAECVGYDSNGNVITDATTDVEVTKEVKNTYSSAEMAEAIDNIEVGVFVPEEGYVLTGDCSNLFAYEKWKWFLEQCIDKISTVDITNANRLFYSAYLEKIPFDINLQSGDDKSISTMFAYNNITEAPYIKGMISNIDALFNSCRYLKHIPEDWADYIDWSYIQTYKYGSMGSVFKDCRSLRHIPENLLSNLHGIMTTSSYAPYASMFYECWVMDDITNIAVCNTTFTSNVFTTTFRLCSRAENITFKTQEDGVQWKSQTIDLSAGVGYATTNKSDFTKYNPEITAEKEVKTQEDYERLKNDPDWWTANVAYSRYNHDSTVNTIHSLPDTSAYGTNTIKFTGSSGELTDGGAVNTLTAEEIAVATAKGWTVTFA